MIGVPRCPLCHTELQHVELQMRDVLKAWCPGCERTVWVGVSRKDRFENRRIFEASHKVDRQVQ